MWQLPPKTYRLGFSLEYGIRLEPQVPEVDGYQDRYSGDASSLDEAESFPLGPGDNAHGVDASLLAGEAPLAPPQLLSR